MSDSPSSTIARAAEVGLVLLSLVFAAYGMYLLIVGVTIVSIPAVPVGSPPGPASTTTVPVMTGVVPTIAGVLILAGLALRRIWLAWIGAAITLLFAGLLVFSIGGFLVPVAAALFVLLGIATWSLVDRASPSSTR